MTNKENRKPNLDTKAPPQADSDLRYLLSAYLFDSLSEEGRTEVEQQLEKSEACRRELDELRETLSLVSEALSDDAEQPSTYSFDQRRMDRVLSAKRRASILRIRLPSRKITAAAAALLLTSLAGILGLMTYSSFEMSAPQDSSFAGEVLTFDSEGRTGGLEPLSGESSPASKPQSRQDADRAVRSAGRKLAPKTISQPEIMRKLGESRVPPPAKAAVSKNAERFYAEEEKFLPDNNEARRVTRKRTPSATKTKRSRSSSETDAAANKPAPSTAPPAPTRKAEKARSEKSPPGQAIAEGKAVTVTDQIGVGGGAAGAYSHRYGKGRLVREKPKFGKSSPTAPPRSEQNRISRPGAPGAAPAAPEELEAAIAASSLDSLNRDGRASKEAVRESLKSLEKKMVTGGLRDRLKKDAADVPVDEVDKIQEQDAAYELSSVEDPEEEESEEEAKKSVLLQKLQETQKEGVYQRQNEQNFDLNIKKTGDGYKSLGLNQSASQQLRKQQAPSAGIDTRTINEKVLNTFSWYRRLDPKLSYDQFNSRALVIPPPALGDEGLGEKGFRAKYGVNPFVAASRDNLSTFGMDVDTASWGRARESIRNKTLPAPQTIRVEEFINNFSDERPGNPNTVFSVYTEGGPSPFGDHGLELIQITLKSRELRTGERKDAILTFAVDTSGSMAADGKINLLKKSIRTLVDKLNPTDRVAIIAFSTNAYVVLPHTPVRQRAEILGAIESLTPTGGTNVEAGIDLAYRLAGESSHKRAANRVILCSDGVANLGARGPEIILKKIARFANEDRIALYTYAFGSGGRQAVKGDKMLQQLANRGDGRYQYVDSGSSAKKIFSVPDELQVLAADAKIQVNFNPDVVSHYRLLGYEKRDIADADFRNDKIDAGEVGPGSTVTAMYEIKRSRPVGSIGRIYLRYKDAVSSTVEEFNYELQPGVLAGNSRDTSDRFRFIASVAEFAELLRGSYYARNGSFGAALQLMNEVSVEFKKRNDWKEAYRSISAAQGLSAVQTLNSIR